MEPENVKLEHIYFKFKQPWYKKLWYFITFRKNKIEKYKEMKITKIGE